MSEHTDYGPVLGSGWIHFLATATLVGGGIAAFILVKSPLTRDIGLIILGIAVIPWLINGFRFWRLRRALGTADLHFDENVPLGFSGTATYARPLRGAELRTINARLQCEEEIVKGSGKNKTRVQRIVYDEPLTTTTTPAMERLEIRMPVRIPAAGPSTMWCEQANIKWWIRLHLRMSGCPNTASSFEVQVLPAVIER